MDDIVTTVPSRWTVGNTPDGWYVLYDKGTVSQPTMTLYSGPYATEIAAFQELPRIIVFEDKIFSTKQ